MPRQSFDLIPDYDPYRDAGTEYFYDAAAGQMVVDFFRTELRFTKGKWKGLKFNPYPAQEQRLKAIFGWRRKSDGQRRYRTVFYYVPRKNGKSEEVSGIAWTCFVTQPENDHEIYIAARDRGQALTLYNMAFSMRNQNPKLRGETGYHVTTKEIRANWDNGKIQAISSDALSQHSLSPSVGIVDELHAQRNGDLIEALKTGMGGREQPLLILISTADIDRPSVCNEELEYAKAVQSGAIIDPRYLPIIYETDKAADPHDPATWAAANPNYPTTPNPDFMQQLSNEAKHSPRKLGSFCRYNLNMQTSNKEGWLDMDLWRLCSADYTEDELENAGGCFAAVDLAYRTDIASLVLLFPDGRTICRFYIPKDRLQDDRTGHYAEYVAGGYLTIAGTDRTDYSAIKQDLEKLNKRFNIRLLGFDPWNANQFAGELEDEGWEVREFRQGYKSMNEPAKETEARIITGAIKHNSPVLDWMGANVSIMTDPAGNIKPIKPEGRTAAAKVDGIICLVMCVGLEMAYTDKSGCYLDDRELRTL